MSYHPKHMLVKSLALRRVLIACGWVSFVLGMIGLLLPVIPTSPFLLLSAACWVRSSPRFYFWLITHRWFGPYLRYYLSGQGIPRRIKVMAIGVLWLMMLPTALLIVPQRWLSATLLLIATAVSIYIARHPEPSGEAPPAPDPFHH